MNCLSSRQRDAADGASVVGECYLIDSAQEMSILGLLCAGLVASASFITEKGSGY